MRVPNQPPSAGFQPSLFFSAAGEHPREFPLILLFLSPTRIESLAPRPGNAGWLASQSC